MKCKAFKTSKISPSDVYCCESRNCFHGDLEGKKNLNNDVIQCAVGKSAYFKYMNIKIKNAINKATDFLVIEQLTFK